MAISSWVERLDGWLRELLDILVSQLVVFNVEQSEKGRLSASLSWAAYQGPAATAEEIGMVLPYMVNDFTGVSKWCVHAQLCR